MMLGWLLTLFSLIVWGVTFASTRALLLDFSPLEIQAVRFSLVLMPPLVVWGLTESGFYALDGSFSVDLDLAENAARFSLTLNLVNLAFLGVLASALTFIAWSVACARLGVVRTTICLYLEPIIGVCFAALFLGERPTAMSLAGGVVILAGVALANWSRK